MLPTVAEKQPTGEDTENGCHTITEWGKKYFVVKTSHLLRPSLFCFVFCCCYSSCWSGLPPHHCSSHQRAVCHSVVNILCMCVSWWAACRLAEVHAAGFLFTASSLPGSFHWVRAVLPGLGHYSSYLLSAAATRESEEQQLCFWSCILL